MKLKKFLVGMMLAATTVSMLGEALARPMGGGRSFGRQSQNVGRQAPAPAPTPAPAAAPRQAQPAPAPAPAPAAKAPSRWKGLLGGALLGLGLGALLSHFGLGGALASMISTLLMVALLAGVAFFIYRMVRGKRDSNASGNAPFAGFGGNLCTGHHGLTGVESLAGGGKPFGESIKGAAIPADIKDKAAPRILAGKAFGRGGRRRIFDAGRDLGQNDAEFVPARRTLTTTRSARSKNIRSTAPKIVVLSHWALAAAPRAEPAAIRSSAPRCTGAIHEALIKDTTMIPAIISQWTVAQTRMSSKWSLLCHSRGPSAPSIHPECQTFSRAG
nr:hypothetical protein [Janthinobacterium sp.]